MRHNNKPHDEDKEYEQRDLKRLRKSKRRRPTKHELMWVAPENEEWLDASTEIDLQDDTDEWVARLRRHL